MFPPVAIEHVPQRSLASPERLSFSPDTRSALFPSPLLASSQLPQRSETTDPTRTLVLQSQKSQMAAGVLLRHSLHRQGSEESLPPLLRNQELSTSTPALP